MGVSSENVKTLGGKDSAYTTSQVQVILLFAFLGTLFDGAEINLIGYPMVYITHSFHVTTIQIVKVLTYQGFASIAGGFLFGWLGDTVGRRWTYAICVVSFGLGAVFGGLANTYITFMLARLLAGLGMGGLFGLSFAMFAECWKTQRRGFMGGSIQCMFIAGEIMTEGVIYFSLTHFGTATGWRTGYEILGVFTLLISIAAMLTLPESKKWLDYQINLKNGSLPRELRRAKVPYADMFKKQYAVGTILFMILSTAMFLSTNSVGAYMPTLLIKFDKVPLGVASIIVLIGYLFTIGSYIGTAYISDLIRRKWAFILSCLVGAIGFSWFLVLILSHTANIGTGFWVYQGFWSLMLCAGAAGGFGVLGVWMSEFYPTRIRSTGSNTSYYVGRGLGAGVYPLFALSIAGSVPMALALGIAGPLAGLVFTWFTKDQTGREITSLE